MDRVNIALKQFCRIRTGEPSSILFGAEKTGSVHLIDTARDVLTRDSHLLYGSRGRPVKLKNHLDRIAAAFRRTDLQSELPYSINGVWKADLFLGTTDADQWVGTTVKSKIKDLEGARGLRVGVVPSHSGSSDAVYKDDAKNLIVCPLPYDGEFVEVFYTAWNIVKQFLEADSKIPKEAAVPSPAHRSICRFLEERREFPVLDVIDVLRPISQPELLQGDQRALTVNYRRQAAAVTGAIIAPIANPNVHK